MNTQPLKEAVSICKTIMRNGFDAYVISARLQEIALREAPKSPEVDICTDMGFDDLRKLYPLMQPVDELLVTGLLVEEGSIIRFYPADAEPAAHVEETVARLTPRLIERLEVAGEPVGTYACALMPKSMDPTEGMTGFSEGEIRFTGLPDEALRLNYLRAIRVLRYSANYHMPIEANSWMSILRNARNVLDHVPVSDILAEWRQVEAENMWDFVRLLYESMILHGLVPELAAMARIKHKKNETEEESVFEHTLAVMRHYPEELPYDWYGTLSCLFHDVGKLYTAEYMDSRWTFYQHHAVGSKITRTILRRLGFEPHEVDLISHLVRHHMRFHFMLTDRGIRRFKALDEYPRLIEMARADLKSRGSAFMEFNHNLKMLERTVIPEEVLEPLLNGREIMEFTGLKPGPEVGLIREALLKAQTEGLVGNVPEAVEFVVRQARGRAKL